MDQIPSELTDERPDFTIERLGPCRIDSPMAGVRFVNDERKILYSNQLADIGRDLKAGIEPVQVEVAGPREKIYFDPSKTKAGIVSCGGLCPGLNDVIRAVVLSLTYHYGVKHICGFQYGYEGLSPKYKHEPVDLNPRAVSRIHEQGGSILGSSHGPQDPAEMVNTLEQMNINVLFTLGGDGTLRGAIAIADEVKKRNLKIAVVGIPKTIDNDISHVHTSFGFDTACSEARRVISGANSEALGARNGIGLVKLMGRDSGFIAAAATLANNDVNFCLVPEVPFSISALMKALQKRIEERGHAVIVVAEGAGQEFLKLAEERDSSGNIRHADIGKHVRDEIIRHFKTAGIEINMKYIDPSYIIRSQPANAHDAAFCVLLGHNAVHAAMTGRTGMLVGNWNGEATHVPIKIATQRRKKIDAGGWLWRGVMSTTGQPVIMI